MQRKISHYHSRYHHVLRCGERCGIVGIFGNDMGPAGAKGALNTMVGFIYDALASHAGRASAAALILFGIILIVTLINLWVSKKRVHY